MRSISARSPRSKPIIDGGLPDAFGQDQQERRSAVTIDEIDRRLVGGQQRSGYRQSEPGSANGAAACEERFEHAGADLTPGDFAVVARQLRFAPNSDARVIVEALRAEANAKPQRAGRLGFG